MKKLLNKLKRQGGEHILFVGATILSSGIHFIYSIYVKAYVAPLEYGIYSTCLLLQTYLAYLQLGSLNAFNRDYPQLIGAGKENEAAKYRNTIFSFLLIAYSISFVIISIFVLLIGRKQTLDSRLTTGFILTALLAVVTIFENYGNYRCRIDKGFKYSSIVTLLELLSIPVGLILIPQIGYYGIYITNIVAMLIGLVFYYRPSFRDFHFNLEFKLLKTILISGTPLLINGLVWTVVNSIDKFVILSFIDTEALGIYGIAQNAFSYMVLIPTAMSQLFYVKMGKEYGQTGSVKTLTDTALKFSTILAAITSLIALVAFYFLPIFVDAFMPNYSTGVPAAQILIVGLSVYAATLVSGNILTILKQNTLLLKNSICMCIFNIVCSVAFVCIIESNVESVALGTSVSYILYTLLIIFQVNKCSKCSIISQFLASVLPVSISMIPGVIIYNLFSNKFLGFIVSLVLIILFYTVGLGLKFNYINGEKK